MSNPTRQEIIDAYKALESLLIAVSGGTSLGPFAITSMSYDIRAALPPKPQPTMADVEWDDDKHYLAEAKSLFHGNVVMIEKDTEDGLIQCISAGGIGGVFVTPPEALTLTGRRYTLTEVQE